MRPFLSPVCLPFMHICDRLSLFAVDSSATITMSSIAQKIDFTMLSDDEPEQCELSINSMSSDELSPAVDGISPPPAARLFHPPSMTSSPRRLISRLPAALSHGAPAGQTPAPPKTASRLARDRHSSTSPSPPYKRIKGEPPHYTTRVGQRFEGERESSMSVRLSVCLSGFCLIFSGLHHLVSSLMVVEADSSYRLQELQWRWWYGSSY